MHKRLTKPPKKSPELLHASAMEVQTGLRVPVSIADAKNANPRKSVAWRYERVTRLLASENSTPHRLLDDRWTKELYRFMASYQALQNEMLDVDLQEFHLARRFPTLSTAFFLFGSREQDPMRYALESRILARQDDETIGQKMRVAPEVVSLYEHMFYDVRDRLDHSDFIATSVIGPVFRVGIGAVSPELICKYFAYFCGPVVLDYILSGFSQGYVPRSDSEVLSYVEQQTVKALKTQAMIMTAVLQPTRFDVRTIMEGFMQLLNIERNSQGGSSAGQSDHLTELVEAIRVVSPIPRGEDAKKLVPLVSRHYAAGNIELRAHEKQIAARLGDDAIPDIERLKAIKPPTIEGDLRVDNSSQSKPGG